MAECKSKLAFGPLLSDERTPLLKRGVSEKSITPSRLIANNSATKICQMIKCQPNSIPEKLIELLQSTSINVQDDQGRTPLHWAAQHQNLSIATWLINAHAWVDVRNHKGFTPLMIASFFGSLSIARLLLENCANPNLASFKGKSAILLAAANNHADMVTLLLEYDANVDDSRHCNVTPLMSAARHGAREAAQALINGGANIHSRLTPPSYLKLFKPITALEIAHWSNQPEALRIILIANLSEYIKQLEANPQAISQYDSYLIKWSTRLSTKLSCRTSRVQQAQDLLTALSQSNVININNSTKTCQKSLTVIPYFFKLARSNHLLLDEPSKGYENQPAK